MANTIDARGLSCPQPVLLFMNALKTETQKELIVLVDTDASMENVSRAAESKNYSVAEVIRKDDEYQLFLVKK